MDPIVTIHDDPSIVFNFPEPQTLSPPILTCDDASVGYAPGQPVLRHLNLRLDPDDRIALLGANGNGKSTLAKLLVGRLDPLSGRVVRHGKLRCGFFAQHQIEDLEAERTPLQHLAELMPKATETQVRGRLGRFGFGQEKALVKVADLSGGEKARLNFALITHEAPPLLVLDEPTNHLDIEAREALVEAINDFAGAVVVISHDWHLLELVADRLWLVADGTVQAFDGDLEDYERRILEGPGTGEGARAGEQEPNSRRAARRLAAERRKELEPLRQRARKAEDIIARLTKEREALDRTLAQPNGSGGNGFAPADALKRRAELVRMIERAEGDWLAAEQAIERESNV